MDSLSSNIEQAHKNSSMQMRDEWNNDIYKDKEKYLQCSTVIFSIKETRNTHYEKLKKKLADTVTIWCCLIFDNQNCNP